MEKKPVGVQLYSLREECAEDFAGVLKSVAAMGYKGVELAGLYGHKPEEVRAMVEDLGMVVASNHGPWPQTKDVNEIVDTALGLGTKVIVASFGPDHFKSLDGIKEVAEATNRMVEQLEKEKVSLALHNHWWEFERLDGRLLYDIMMEMCPGVKAEMDIYWAANFGAEDPAEQTRKHADRVVLMHVKDGPLVQDAPHVALGEGQIDVPAVIQAADPKVLQWLIVELDHCATDMEAAVAASYRYLISEGLAEGNK